MVPYWALFSIFAFGALFSGANFRRQSLGPILAFLVVIVVLMVGLRYRVGGDWVTYSNIFVAIQMMSLEEALSLTGSDPAYSLLNWIAQQLGLGIWFVNLVCAAILVWGVKTLAVRQPNPWLVFVIAIPYLIIVVGMGYTRQSAAIGLSMVAISALSESRLHKFLGAIVLAALFHKSAVILLPILGLVIAHNRWVKAGLSALIGLMLYYFLISANLEELTANYLEAELQSEGAAIRVAMNVLPSAIFVIAQHRFGLSNHERKIWRNLSAASLVALIGLLVLPSSTVVDRLVLNLSAVQLVVFARLPWAFGSRHPESLLLILLVVTYSAMIQFVWLNYAAHAPLWVPYRIFPLGIS